MTTSRFITRNIQKPSSEMSRLNKIHFYSLIKNTLRGTGFFFNCKFKLHGSGEYNDSIQPDATALISAKAQAVLLIIAFGSSMKMSTQ